MGLNLKIVHLLSLSYFLILLSLNFDGISVNALNIGVEHFYHTSHLIHLPFVSTKCSRKCESEFCEAPPLLRYGKYCGLLYSGCPEEKPCDGLDTCCMEHDNCISRKNNDYLSQECSRNLINCMDRFAKSRGRGFNGSKCDARKVIKVIKVVMEPALAAGKALGRP
ncbi:phospholipase A2-alpha-like [Chenopodium quinoa]|uniref:phospholipase A2-alpha-like n=1 Tax=Chenopodium quinoa TaxID=63459 RepID=UPI000B799F30|nr:phospholipase A2-alpha-like [Chenopodium quinoa]